MAKILLDNLLKVFRSSLTLTGATQVSKELDFDIPRGFVIKIHEVTLEISSLSEDFEGISVDKLARVNGALVKDPDDTSTIGPPTDSVDHDVIADINCEILIVAGVAGDTAFWVSQIAKKFNFSAEGVDVITARNMRLNVDVFGTDAADLTESAIQVTVHYTLEKITDADILALLDIL